MLQKILPYVPFQLKVFFFIFYTVVAPGEFHTKCAPFPASLPVAAILQWAAKGRSE